jgi:hypothetical protein
VLLAFGAVYIQRITSGKAKYFIRPLALLLTVLLFIPIAKLAFPHNDPQRSLRIPNLIRTWDF